MKCPTALGQRGPWPSVWGLTAADDTQWSEEDWADHFSSLVLNEVNTALPNIGCALVMTYKNSYAWQLNLPNPREDDPHSSGFLRLLFIGIDRGTIDPHCRSLLDDVSGAGRGLQCQ